MTPNTVFYIIIGIVIFNFVSNKVIAFINAKHFKDEIPVELQDIYNQDDYINSQAYKRVNYNFSNITSTFSLLVTLAVLFLDGFEYVDHFARAYGSTPISIGLFFFGIIFVVSEILMLPFAYYKTFVIETKFGFNKTTKKLFVIDKIKSWTLTFIVGGILLALVIWFYQLTTTLFWLYAWGLITLVSLITNLFYSKFIVPLFNKQTPLKDGNLKHKILVYAKTVGFTLDHIFVINGSKRSTKANAYFSGFGKQKRITLYDTLINDLDEDEIVAVLAHEVGHYKHKHIIFNLITSVLLTGCTLYLLCLLISNPILANALGVTTVSFHIGIVAFGLLYTPISEITGLIMNYVSRKFEYQADHFAKTSYKPEALVNALKKLSKNSLSNLTPHPAYVFMHYSHPTLLQRISKLNK